jgi:predicted DNA repair protein MutK
MAGSLLALLDDVSSILDDVATLTKVAATKTTGVLGDDLALNAEQIIGINADRELPVIWGVAKGSLINKAILIPSAIGLSAFVPGAIIPLLTVGGVYLCYEGTEKIIEKLFHKEDHRAHSTIFEKKTLTKEQEAIIEKDKIKGAVKTDFILSAEIIAIALGTFSAAPLLTQSISLVAVGVAMTAGVYGTVAAIVKMDDVGLWMMQKKSTISQKFGKGLVNLMPKLMKGLTFAGTAAMFTVGGAIVKHGLEYMGVNSLEHLTSGLNPVVSIGIEASIGLIAGAISVSTMTVKYKVLSFFNKDSNTNENLIEIKDENHKKIDKKSNHPYHNKYKHSNSIKKTITPLVIHGIDLIPEVVNNNIVDNIGQELENSYDINNEKRKQTKFKR